jgi:hypothetical protein
MKVRAVLTDAIYLSGLGGASLSTPTGDWINRALILLNDLLAERNSDGELLPYYEQIFVDAVADQQKYFIPKLAFLETCAVIIGDGVRLDMALSSRETFFQSNRVLNVSAIPQEYYSERIIQEVDGEYVDGTQLWVYYLPQQSTYQFQITGRFLIDDLTYDDDILEKFGRFYIPWIKYKLASRICDFYNMPFTPQNMQTLTVLEAKMNDINAYDYSMKKRASFAAGSMQNPASSRMSGGWWT